MIFLFKLAEFGIPVAGPKKAGGDKEFGRDKELTGHALCLIISCWIGHYFVFVKT